MKSLLNFLVILFLYIIVSSCSSSDDNTPLPKSSSAVTPTTVPPPAATPPVTTPPVTTPPVATPPAVTPPAVTPVVTPVVTPPNPVSTDVIITFEADLKPDGVTTITYATLIGFVTVLLNQTNRTFKIKAGADNFNPTYVNIHTVDGTIVFVFPFSSTSATYAINDDQIAELMANRYYVNLKGTDGDINGQLINKG